MQIRRRFFFQKKKSAHKANGMNKNIYCSPYELLYGYPKNSTTKTKEKKNKKAYKQSYTMKNIIKVFLYYG